MERQEEEGCFHKDIPEDNKTNVLDNSELAVSQLEPVSVRDQNLKTKKQNTFRVSSTNTLNTVSSKSSTLDISVSSTKELYPNVHSENLIPGEPVLISGDGQLGGSTERCLDLNSHTSGIETTSKEFNHCSTQSFCLNKSRLTLPLQCVAPLRRGRGRPRKDGSYPVQRKKKFRGRPRIRSRKPEWESSFGSSHRVCLPSQPSVTSSIQGDKVAGETEILTPSVLPTSRIFSQSINFEVSKKPVHLEQDILMQTSVISSESSMIVPYSSSQGERTIKNFQEKWPGKVCAFCNLCEKSVLGQGELKYFEPALGFNPFKKSTKLQQGSCKNDDDVLQEKSSKLLSERRNCGPLKNTRERIKSPRLGGGCHSCNNPVDELEILGFPDEPDPSMLFEPSGHFYAHHWCATWSEGVCHTEDYGLANIEKAVFAGMSQRCSYCKTIGATIRCKENKCDHVYHYPCAAGSGGFQDMKTLSFWCPLHLNLASTVDGLDVTCNSCKEPGNLQELLLCSNCGSHYHGNCLKPPVLVNPVVRTGWQCPDCKICQTCRSPGYNNKILVCDVCDKGYHMHCVLPVMNSIPKNGWKCKNCRVCGDCGSRTPGNGLSSRWHRNYTVCDSCYQQRNKGIACPLCGKAYRQCTGRAEMTRCKMCRKFIHQECDPQIPKQWQKAVTSPYICPVCRETCQQVSDLRYDVASITQSQSRDESDPASIIPDTSVNMMKESLRSGCDDSVASVDTNSVDAGKFGSAPSHPLGFTHPNESKFSNYSTTRHLARRGKFLGKRGLGVGRPRGSGKFTGKRSVSISEFQSKRGPKPRGVKSIHLPGIDSSHVPTSSEIKELKSSEPGKENKLIFCTTSDEFVLSQDLCVMCGSFGKGEEGRLIACSQCGQCYHPYCVNVKVTKVILSKGWRCLDCTVCEGCGKPHDEGLLLLCDICDISYHTYCLDPPLDDVPQGNWKCNWCVVCLECGSRSPGYGSSWQNNYTCCGPCASKVTCLVCHIDYQENELIIQCIQCYRWLHGGCDQILSEEDAEHVSDHGYHCILCRPVDEQPPHLLSPPKPLPPPTESVHLSSSVEIAKKPESVPPPKPQPQFYVDGVYLSESGMDLIKALTVEQPKKQRMRRPRHSVVEQPLAPGEEKGAVASDITGDQVGMETEVRMEVCDGREDNKELATDASVEKKKRQKKLHKLGIGGFIARQRSRSLSSKEQANEHISIVQEQTNGLRVGEVSTPVVGEPHVELPQPFQQKPKRKRRVKKKNALQESFPSYLQEAFFGRELLDTCKSESSFEISGDESAGIPIVNQEDIMSTIPPTGLSDEAQSLQISISNTSSLGGTLFSGASCTEALLEPMTFSTASFSKLLSLELPGNQEKEEGKDILQEKNTSQSKDMDDNFGYTKVSNTLPSCPEDTAQQDELISKLMNVEDDTTKQTEVRGCSEFTVTTAPDEVNVRPSAPHFHPTSLPSSGYQPLPQNSATHVPLIHQPTTPSSNIELVSSLPSYTQLSAESGSSQLSAPSSPWPEREQLKTPPQISIHIHKNVLKWESDEALGDKATISSILYTNINMPQLKIEYPNWPDRAKQIAKIWRSLPSEKRQLFVQQAKENRAANRMQKRQADSARGTRKNKEMKEREQEFQASQQLEMPQEQKEQAPSASTSPARTPVRLTSPMMSAPLIPDLMKTGTSSCIPTPPFTVFSDPDFIQATMIGQTLPSHDQISPSQSLPSPSHAQRSPEQSEVASSSNPLSQVSRVRLTEVNHLSPENINSQPPSTTQPVCTSYFLVSQCPSFISQPSVAQPRAVLSTMSPSKQNRTSGHASLSIPSTDSYSQPSSTLHTFMPQDTFLHQSSTSNPDTSLRSGLSSVTLNSVDPCTKVLPDSHSQQFVPNNLSSSSGTPTSRHVSELPYSQPPSFSSADPYSQPVLTPRPPDATHTMNDPYARHSRKPHPSCISGTTTTVVSHLVGEPAVSHPEQNLPVAVCLTEETPQMPSQQLRDLLQRHQFIQQQIPVQSWSSATGTEVTSSQSTILKMSNVQKLGGQDAVNSHIQQGMYNTVLGTSRVTGMEGNFRHPLPPGMRPRFPTSPGQPFGHTTPTFGRKLVSLGGQFNSRLQMVLLPQHQLRGQSLAPGQVRIAGPHPRMSTGFGENVNELCDLQPQKQQSPLPQNQHMTGDLLGSSGQPAVCSSLSQIPEHHKQTVILSVLSHARKDGVNPSVRHCFPVASSELTRQTVSVSQALNQFVISSNCSFTQPLTTCGIMSHITRPAVSGISQSVRGLHQHPQSLQTHIIMRQSVASDVSINKALFAHPGHTSTLESKSESSLLETSNFEETPQRRTTPEDLVNVVNEQTVTHEAECEIGDELDDDDDELLGLGNDFNILEYADPELVDKGLFDDGEKNNILDEHLDLDDKDDMKCKTDMGNEACRNSIDKDQCISFQVGDKTNVESNEKSFQDAPDSRFGSDNFQAKFSKYNNLERVKDTKEGVIVGLSSIMKSEASDSELVSHLSEVIDSSQKSAEEKQLLSEGVRVPSAESVYQLFIKSGSPVIQSQQGNAEVKPVSQVLTVSQSSISIPVSSSQGSVGVTQLPNKVLLSHSAQYIPNVPSPLSYPIDNTHSSQPSPASSSQHRHFLQRPGQVVTVIPRTSESPVQKSEIGQSDQHSLIENHSLLLEELVQKEKLEQHGKSQDGLVSLPPDALLNDVDFEQLKADVLSCFPDDSFGGPGPVPSAQELSQPTVTSVDKFKLSRPISSQFFHEAQKQRDKSQQLVDWKGHQNLVSSSGSTVSESPNPHQKHFPEVSDVSASVGSQGGNVTRGEPHVRRVTSRQTSPAGSSVTPHPHGFYTITSLPTPPLPPAEPSNDREGQQHSNYEQWLLQQQQLLSSNQKYLETEVGKLRKVKKSLNAKQRTLRKNGQELGEQDAFELDRITQEQAELQKQLDQARKHSRKHNVLFQDYQVKQQKKQLQQHPQIAGTTQLPTQSPVLSQGPPTPYMTDPNAPQSPMLSPSPLGTSQSPQLQHFSTVVSPSSIIQNLPQIGTSQTVAGAMPNLIHTAQNDVTCLNENFQQQEYHSEHQLFSQPSIQQQQLVSPKLHPSPGPLSRNFMMPQIVSQQHSFSPGSQDAQQQCFSPENPNMQQQRFSPGAQQHFVVGSPNSQQPPYSPVLQQQQLSLGAQGVHKARFLLPQPSSILTPQHQQQIPTSGVYQLTQQQPQIIASQDVAPHQKPQQVFSQAVQLQHPPSQNQVSSQQLLSQEGSVGDEVKRQELLQRIQFLRENNISLSQFPGQVGLHFALNSSNGQSRLAVPSGVNPNIIGRQAVPPTCAQEVRSVQMPFYSGRQRPFLPYPTHIRLFSSSSSNPAKTDSVLTALTTLQNVNPCKSSIVVRGQPTVEVVYSSSGPTFRVVSIHDSERENAQHEALEGGIVNTIGHSLSLNRTNLTSQGTKIVHKIPIPQKSNTDFSASAHNQAQSVDEESKEVISGSPKSLSCTDKLSQQLFESKLISLKEDNETKGRHLAVEFLEPHEPTKTGQSSVGNIDATGKTENWHTSLLHSDLVSELNQGMLNHIFSTGQRHNNFQFQKEIKIEEVTSTSKIETPQLLNFFQSSSHSDQKDKLSKTTLSSSGNPSSSRYSQKAGISSHPVIYNTVRPSCSSYGSFSDVCNNVSSISVPSERFVSHENVPEKPRSVVQSENRCGSTTSPSSVFVFNQTSDYKLASTRNVSLDESSVHLDPSREDLFSTLIHKQEGIKPEASKITAKSFSTSKELRAKEGTVEELGEGTFELFVVGSPEGQTNDSPAPMLPAKEDRTNQEEESGLSCPTDVQTKGKEYRDSTNRNLAGLSTSSSFHTKFSHTKMETEICSGEKDSGSQKSSVPPCTTHNQEDVTSREMVEVQEKTLDDVEIRFSLSETTADENIYRDQGNLHLFGQPQVDIFHKHSLSLEGNVNQKVLLKELLKNSSLGKLKKEMEKVEDIKNNQDTESGPGKVEPCNEDNNKNYPEELKEKKPTYLDLRRAQLEKDPTPPPEDVKPKKKRPKKRKESKDEPLTKKKQVKGSQGEEDHDTSMDTVMRHVKAMSPVTISEPCMKPNFNLCKVFGSGNLRNKVLDCRLRGGYGNATLMSQSDHYSTQPFDSDPPMPTSVPSNSPPVRSYYCDEFVNTVGDPLGFMGVSVSISTPQLFINHERIIRDTESPETIISSSSPECEMIDPPEIFPGLSFTNSNESSSRERFTCSPVAPIVAPIPIRASTNITDGSPTSASDSDEEKDKENVIKAKNQHDLFVYKSKKLRLGKHPVPLKDCGNVAVTLTLSSSESDDIQGVLNALADLLKIPHPTSFEVDCTATSVQKFGLHNKAKHPTVNINQSLLDVKPRFCMHCDIAIVGAGIQKKASELPYSSKDEWEKDEVTFCNTDCYVQFALMHKSTASSDQEKTATVVSHLGNATLSEKCTSTGENKGARISENCWTAEDVAKSETDKPCNNILHVSAESSPTPEIEKTKLDVVHDVANVSAKTKEEEMVQDQFVSLNEKTKSNISCEISRAKKHSIVDKHKYSEPLSKKWHGLRWKFWKEGSLSSPMNRNLSEKDLGQTFDTTSVCVKPSRGLKDERMCVLCHEMGDGDTEGPARLLNADVEKWVHLNCALWSAEVYETVNGALINVETAFKRAMVSVCVRCQMIGASLHCFKPRCTNVYHFPCAFHEKCTFYKDKSMLCPQHVPKVPVLDNELESMAVFRRVYINREEHKQIASMIHQGDKYLIRIGSLILCNVGQLLPHQLQAFHSPTSIYPVGYKAVRMYWSIRRLGKRCRYVCSISDFSGKPHFQIQVQEPGHDEFTLKDSTPKGVWQQVLEPIQEMRQQAKTINVFPNFVTGEDLFGLTEPAIVHILESLPGVDSLTDYGFRYGRSSLLDLPLAINPTGCVRTEPKLSTHFKRLHTLHTSNTFKSSLHSTLGEAEANSPYIKQFVHSKSSQYRKMKTDWRNYVYLARSRIQGLGLYAAKNIEKHTVVIEYIGVIIRNEIAERNEREYTKKNRGVYMFRLDENRVIDATLCGGLARYINHSCNPNCVAEEVEIDREKKVLIIANRNITCGEELSYDYRFELENDECKLTCLCGAPNCRKWMN